MTGRLIAVVGPSGVGKDSVMRAMVDTMPNMVLARRVITRPSDAGGEDFDGVTDAVFDQMLREEAFVLSWPAHGLRYGIPRAVLRDLDASRDVLANLSRKVLQEAAARFPHFTIILLSASPDVLAARLRARGREDEAEIARRLAQAAYTLPDDLPVHQIDNSGALDDTVTAALRAVQPARA
ncbi:phosphonate metabolism protein/1,5-bisphosphokinase (PRPP-forming) PhnN [Cognatiyoonia sp. IB215182]|uniref:phosphonate metabolism protein/1,5-bisphosphokinase (PRPP-forming) PhnN n=1 Tax=Cognatiyoonia sp. IB215182 TaxID=3097353 RepID=UPI002A0D83E9|nr:phosphonate metabolism protein/1,5-bisphosphokinase (PRPP-forming) PhnN [Cognatiyoonia sp. IB215182]MDX8351832.1 phosphonate metabolism protein/1,5-bisphosphokinase (PRPP-forming) PhnN [Cognatiyoonia sp. IB215182]